MKTTEHERQGNTKKEDIRTRKHRTSEQVNGFQERQRNKKDRGTIKTPEHTVKTTRERKRQGNQKGKGIRQKKQEEHRTRKISYQEIYENKKDE